MKAPFSRREIANFAKDFEAAKRLRSAAPVLLEALVAAKSLLIELYERDYPDDESDNKVTEVIDLAIEAIALAKGDE